MWDFVALVAVLTGCLFAYFAIGDLFDRWFGKPDPDLEEEHRRARPLSHTDRPAHDPRKDIGGFTDENYGSGTRSITTPHPND